jgi:hypothetical protein
MEKANTEEAVATCWAAGTQYWMLRDQKERKEGRRMAYLLPCVVPFSTHLEPWSANHAGRRVEWSEQGPEVEERARVGGDAGDAETKVGS